VKLWDGVRGYAGMTFVSALLYAPGAFFFYPWKALALLSVGDTYAVAYKHFRRDHSDATNLLLHGVALSWQLLGNFGLIAAVDRVLFPHVNFRPISTLTSISWMATLQLSPAPSICSQASIASIAVAYAIAPRLAPSTIENGSMVCFVAVLCGTSLTLAPSVTVDDGRASVASRLARNLATALAYFGVAIAARWAASPWQGQLASSASAVNLGLAALMVLFSMLPKPVVPCVLGGILVARPLAELTGQGVLLLYGNAFMAQLSQGIAHDVSRQKATLLSHEDSMADRRVRLAFDCAHCCYFPTLWFHSCYQSLLARGGGSRPSRSMK